MAVYRYCEKAGRLVDRETGAPMVPPGAPFVPVAPMAFSDIAPYRSPVTGEVIGGRRAKRDDLAKHNCVDAADIPSPTGGKFRDPRMVKKYNLPQHLLKESAR
jgi:hypothetical protein